MSFTVICQETNLWICAERRLDRQAREAVVAARGHIEGFIARHPDFAITLAPWSKTFVAPPIVRTMLQAGLAAGVGPMAAVAGAIAESVGRQLLAHSRQVIVENGGDIFLQTGQTVVLALFAGASPLSMKVGIRLPAALDGVGVCTSSATVGPSLSTGAADAVCVLSPSCALADAAATAVGNRIRHANDIKKAIEFGKRMDGVTGMVAIVGRKMGVWGEVELVPANGKKG